jgi:hypothetical protein
MKDNGDMGLIMMEQKPDMHEKNTDHCVQTVKMVDY